MAIRKILQYPEDDKALRQKSVAVQKVDKRIRKLVKDLKDTLAESNGAGLAAVQIGVHERVALVKFGQEAEGGMREPITLINPQIISAGPDEKGFDGCLSIPGVVTWDTLRPSPLIFSALDERGETFQMEVSGIDARVVHHEIDHLDGILFLDRVKDFNKVYRSVETDEGEKLVSLASLKAKIEKEIFKTTPIEKVLTKTR
jgi:peptide deformylase